MGPGGAAAAPEGEPEAKRARAGGAGMAGARAGAAAAAWAAFRAMGSPSRHVAPMVDGSELAFRMLCRRHGADCAYSPMIHARLFVENPKYRESYFTTCAEDRPLLAQFCANEPDTLLAAARLLEDRVDMVDLNLGCPQRIAKRGNYGAFLMDDLPRVEAMVSLLARELKVPVSCKIRIFPEDKPYTQTLAYAKMLERAGCQLLAVHGRTREQKRAADFRADWDAIRAVREHVDIPVLANGDVRHLRDARALMEHTGAVGVLSADPLLRHPGLFDDGEHDAEGNPSHEPWACCDYAEEYLELSIKYDTPHRIIVLHMFRFLGEWFKEHHDLREKFSKIHKHLPRDEKFALIRSVCAEMRERIRACGRSAPVPKLSERALARIEREEAIKAAKAEQDREARALAEVDAAKAAAAAKAPDAAAEAAQEGAAQAAPPATGKRDS